MNFLQRTVAGMASAVGLQASDPRDVDAERWWSAYNAASVAGQAVTSQTAPQHWAVRACVEALSGSVSTLPIMVFERLDGDRRRVAKEHPLYQVLRRPNMRQTTQEFMDEQQRHLMLWRNCYSRIVPAEDGGPIGQLEPIHPKRLRDIRRGPDGWLYYTFTKPAPEFGSETLREDSVWHIRKAPLTDDGLRGRAVWETDRETIGKALAVEAFGAMYFANGGSGGGVLKHPGTFKDKQAQADFLDAWRSGGSGLNRHKDRLLLYGVDYTPFSVNNDEAQFLETKKQCGYEVASIWNMPPHRVGMLERATNNNVEQQGIEYVVYTQAPWVCAWEQAAWRDLLIGDDQDRYFVEINVAGLFRGDLKSRWAAYMQGRQGGWLSVNDIRRLENMDPIGPAGDDYLQPLNMAPVGADPKETNPDA